MKSTAPTKYSKVYQSDCKSRLADTKTPDTNINTISNEKHSFSIIGTKRPVTNNFSGIKSRVAQNIRYFSPPAMNTKLISKAKPKTRPKLI